MNLTVCPLRGPGSIPGRDGVIQAISPWLITPCQPVLSQRGRKWFNFPSMTPHRRWTSRNKAEVQLDNLRHLEREMQDGARAGFQRFLTPL